MAISGMRPRKIRGSPQDWHRDEEVPSRGIGICSRLVVPRHATSCFFQDGAPRSPDPFPGA
eukprot:1732517-Pyramimonas_sp.AAC.1